MYTIGEEVIYLDNYGKEKTGTISGVSSDMDSYVNVIVENDVIKYWSKKLKKHVPVKSKNMDTIYFTIPNRNRDDFILVRDIVRGSVLYDGTEAKGAHGT